MKASKRAEQHAKGYGDRNLSPSSLRLDQAVKLNKYRDAGVREYWIVSPEARSVPVCLLDNGKYTIQGFTDSETVPVSVLGDCTIDLSTVFPPVEPKPSAKSPLKDP